MPKIAVVQHAPCVLDREATVQRGAELVGQAAAAGAELVVFPEAFVPGYPAWIWRLRPGEDWDVNEQIYARLLKNAVNLEDDDLAAMRTAAREHKATLVVGLQERDSSLSRATLYNTVVTM